ncbi:MAG: hypothetical protein ACE5IQ_06070 [Candidatus Methylomirabilales bacterium]
MRVPLAFLFAWALALAGCVGPVALHEAVLGYDETISRLESELLLLNIARAHHNLPDHFTVTSAIAATFDYRANVGFVGNFVNAGGDSYSFTLGASVAENPTLSIVPVQGEEFTKRILSPMDEGKFEFLVFQGAPLDMVLRLMADGIELQNRNGAFERFILNWPTAPKEYEEFRRRALHLRWLNRTRNLFVGPVTFEEAIRAKLPVPPSAGELVQALERGYRWRRLGAETEYELSKTVTGRVAVTNYDPRMLSNAERRALNARAAANPPNFVLVDIRPGYPGGDFPLSGAIKLRSLNVILAFVAGGIGRSREYDVGKDPRTETVGRNPARALAVEVSDIPPADTMLRTAYAGQYYWVPNTPWDREAFVLLSKLFQMTVTDVSRVGVPVTISK